MKVSGKCAKVRICLKHITREIVLIFLYYQPSKIFVVWRSEAIAVMKLAITRETK